MEYKINRDTLADIADAVREKNFKVDHAMLGA